MMGVVDKMLLIPLSILFAVLEIRNWERKEIILKSQITIRGIFFIRGRPRQTSVPELTVIYQIAL